MTKLKHSKVYRGGKTTPKRHLETSVCSFETHIPDQSLDFRFYLASKGGGTTEVILAIGLNDLPVILEAVASGMPESVGALSNSAALASKKILEKLAKLAARPRDV